MYIYMYMYVHGLVQFNPLLFRRYALSSADYMNMSDAKLKSSCMHILST